jgi:penicillin-binding protein 1A
MGARQAALVAMRTDGSVVAMVGGRDYRQSAFNRAVSAKRQPGSAFKPFVYLAALRQGFTPDSLVDDSPIRIGTWTPENYEGEYAGGPIPLRDAFARSSNVAAVRLEQAVGLDNVRRAARDLGVTDPLPQDATLALGTADLSLMELTSAYAGIDAGGAPVKPRGLERQESSPEGLRIDPRVRSGMLEMMHAVVTSGTGTAADMDQPVYGKTGTTSDYHDAWFVGFLGDLVVGVWVGNDDNSPMRRVTGGTLPAQIWRAFMIQAAQRMHLRGEPPPGDRAPLIDPPGFDVLAPPGLGAPPAPYAQPPPPEDAAEPEPGPREMGPPDRPPPDDRRGFGWRRRFAPPPDERQWRGFGRPPPYVSQRDNGAPDEPYRPRYDGPDDERGPPPDDDE